MDKKEETVPVSEWIDRYEAQLDKLLEGCHDFLVSCMNTSRSELPELLSILAPTLKLHLKRTYTGMRKLTECLPSNLLTPDDVEEWQERVENSILATRGFLREYLLLNLSRYPQAFRFTRHSVVDLCYSIEGNPRIPVQATNTYQLLGACHLLLRHLLRQLHHCRALTAEPQSSETMDPTPLEKKKHLFFGQVLKEVSQALWDDGQPLIQHAQDWFFCGRIFIEQNYLRSYSTFWEVLQENQVDKLGKSPSVIYKLNQGFSNKFKFPDWKCPEGYTEPEFLRPKRIGEVTVAAIEKYKHLLG